MDLPIPNGVIAETGETRPSLDEDYLKRLVPDSQTVLARDEARAVLAVDGSVDDAGDLTQTGWGVLFASDVDPAIREALKPLLEWRQSKVNDDRLFKVFEGNRGVMPRQSPGSWAASRNVSLVAPVNPRRGVPFYLMLVGSPERISFDFQAQFDLQWAVGRLDLDSPEGYARYAESVIAYEAGQGPEQKREIAVWMTRNPLDMATAMLAGSVGSDFQGQLDDAEKLGESQKFALTCSIGDGDGSDGAATKAKLAELLGPKGPPLLFTGSHGAEFSIEHPVLQRAGQGALVTQEWSSGKKLDDTNHFAASDVPPGAKLDGRMAFLFSCFGGGCPANDMYFIKDGAPIPLAPQPMIAALPKVMLGRGMLAVIAHIDRAFSYGFEDAVGTPQSQLMRTPLQLLMKGKPVGLAADCLNLQWSSYAALLGMAQAGNLPGRPNPPSAFMLNLAVARDDARNYVVLGDPAVRLRTDLMK